MTGNDSMVVEPELDSKTDSVFYALGIAQAMQQLAARGRPLVAPTMLNDRLLDKLEFDEVIVWCCIL